jgi:hypothetical protein
MSKAADGLAAWRIGRRVIAALGLALFFAWLSYDNTVDRRGAIAQQEALGADLARAERELATGKTASGVAPSPRTVEALREGIARQKDVETSKRNRAVLWGVLAVLMLPLGAWTVLHEHRRWS